MPVDCIYICASTRDARYTRICVASVRFFYPQISIRLLVGGRLQHGLERELRYYYNVSVADIPVGNYGWGFVHWEPLFGPSGEKFLVLDSDTVLAGPVLDLWNDSQALFLVDDEKPSEAATKELYYDWEKVRLVDSASQPPKFVFNCGQWFGTSGVLTRDDFAPWVEWTMPRRVRHPGLFMCGDQGIFNYVLNKKVLLDGLAVDRRKIMRWPKHSMEGLEPALVRKRVAAPVVVHWSGPKRVRQRDMIGADLLSYFEETYYQHFPFGGVRRRSAAYMDVLAKLILSARRRMKLRPSR